MGWNRRGTAPDSFCSSFTTGLGTWGPDLPGTPGTINRTYNKKSKKKWGKERARETQMTHVVILMFRFCPRSLTRDRSETTPNSWAASRVFSLYRKLYSSIVARTAPLGGTQRFSSGTTSTVGQWTLHHVWYLHSTPADAEHSHQDEQGEDEGQE